jgi:Mrp family chromosome partitioning ATPase
VNVREYWTVLREDKWLVGGVLVVCVAIAAAVALLLPRTYTSTAIFYVASPQSTTSSTDSYSGAQLSTERVKSYTELITGPRVAADASALLGGRPSAQDIQKAVTADAVDETVVLNLGVTESTPQDAQLVGTAVATSFTRLVNSIESTGQPVNRPIVSTELIYPPTLPTFPAGPGTTMLLAAGLLAGVVLGVGAALGRRALRRAIDGSETLETALGAPVLAAVPGLPRRPTRPALLLEPAPGRRGRGAARARTRAAAVRRLRTAVLAGSDGRRCLVIAGARAEQGTTTVAVDLAVALALAGESVLLVDADLRRPALARRLELGTDRGLATVLDGAPVPGAVQRWAPGGLDVLPAGPGVARPGEAWGSPRAAAALQELRDAYGWVLLDASPVASSPESVDLARLADGVVLVARRGSARPEDLDAAAAGLRTVGAPLLGSVFTFAVDVPDAPVEAPRALPPGRADEHRPEVVEAPAAEEPAAEPEPDATTAPKRRTSTRRTTPPKAPAADAAPTAPDAEVPARAATRTRKPRSAQPAAAGTTPDEQPTTAATAEAPATPPAPTEKPARKPRAPRRTATAKTAAGPAQVPDTAAAAPTRTGTDEVPAVGAVPTTADASGSVPTPAAGTAEPAAATRVTGSPASAAIENGSGSSVAGNGAGTPENGTTAAGRNGATGAGTNGTMVGQNGVATASAAAAENGVVTTSATAGENGSTGAAASENGAVAPPASNGNGSRPRRATRATTRASVPEDATTTVEGAEAAEKPTRARTTRTRTTRPNGNGPESAETVTRPARTRSPRATTTNSPTSGS